MPLAAALHSLRTLPARLGIAIITNVHSRRLDAWKTPDAYFLLLGPWEVVVDRR